MPAQIINGKTISQEILTNLKSSISNLQLRPKLGVVFVGNNKASQSYINKKRLACQKVGINFSLFQFKENISEQELIAELKKIQNDPALTGLIVQLPIPKHLQTQNILDTVQAKFDVDCLNSSYLQNLSDPEKSILPPTPAAIIEILKKLKVNFSTKQFVILGNGRLVGKPLTIILQKLGAEVITCDKKTKNIPEICQKADVIITATGQKDLVRGDMVKPGAIVIDAGVSFIGKKMFGDINFDEVKNIASAVTPTPGGVGPITVAMLLKNTYEASHRDSNL